MKVCNSCGAVFPTNDLKLTCKGFGCPYCDSINHNDVQGGQKKWEDTKVTYEEGQHD